jgi:hypothetical protein
LIRLPSELEETIRKGGTVIVPSRQRAHAARLAHAAAELKRGQRVWKSPDILTTEAWLIREIEELAAAAGEKAGAASRGEHLPRLLGPAEEWFLWHRCTDEATRDLSLVNHGALSENLRRASGLAADYNIDVRKLVDSGCAEPGLLRDVQQTFQDRCRSLGVASVAELSRTLKSSSRSTSAPLRFAGFTSIPPRLARLANSMGATPPAARPAWDGPGRPGTQTRVHIASDEWEEMEAIADWCRRQVERVPDARVLVILPGSPGSRERLAALIRQAIHPRSWLEPQEPESLVVVEGGRPLTQVPAIKQALSTLSWLSGRSAEFNDFSEWLRAPYWTLESGSGRARLDAWLRERGHMQIRLRDLASSLRDVPGSAQKVSLDLVTRVVTGTKVLSEGGASPRDWSQRFGEALKLFGWPGDRTRTSQDQQNVKRFHELLDEFGQLASSFGSLSRNDAIQYLTELAGRTSFQPADEDPTVTISATPADPVVQYDALWIAAQHAEALPQPVQPDPFLPLGVQVAAGIPASSAEGRLQEAHSLIQAWRASANEVVLSTASRSEDLELLPSPLLTPWLRRERPKPAKGQLALFDTPAAEETLPVPLLAHGPSASGAAEPLWLPARIHRDGQLEAVEDCVGPAWPVSLQMPGGTRSLELQNECPFRAFAELRLGSSPLETPEPGIDAKERGNLLHASLSRLWQRLVDSSALTARSAESLEREITECVETAAAETFGSSSPPGFNREIRRTVQLIAQLCELERTRRPFRVQGTEFDSVLALAGGELRIRIDRVDELAGGGRAVIDYKTGRRKSADWYGERPTHIQLMAYLAALGPDVIALATANVTAREVRFDGIANEPNLLPKVRGVQGDWDVRRREWVGRLEALAQGFLEGQAAVDPKPGACEYCPVSGVCRISKNEQRESDEF